MDKPCQAKDIAFELYIRNFPMQRIIDITGSDEKTMNCWMEEGNWVQLKKDLDATPVLRDLGRRINPERARLTLIEFVAQVMLNDPQLGSQLFNVSKKLLSGEELLPEMPAADPVGLN